MLRVEHLKVGSLPALTFAVADGECLAIEGPSGSGKTRLLRAIADLDQVEGHVFLDGVERRELTGPQWRRAVRYVAAEAGWWTDTARPAISQTGTASARTGRMITTLGLTDAILDKPLSQLSTGERQRLALARALGDEPRVLLLDEPTGALDATSSALVEELIRFQMLAGRSVLLASHDVLLVGRLAHVRLQLARPQPAVSPTATRRNSP
ncbi:MAG: ATP-binding cassette domain-containing protein [Hyphomicrobium sp.]